MSNIDYSGPAFPVQDASKWQAHGMTRRAYFACTAMQAMVSVEYAMYAVEHTHSNGIGVGQRWAQQAVLMADALIAELDK